MLQLRLGDIPGRKGLYGTGLLQLFHCPRFSGACEAGDSFIPFSNQAIRVRIIRPTPRGRAAPVPPNYEPPEVGPQELLQARQIVGWEQFDDLARLQEVEETGLQADYDFKADTVRIVCPEAAFDVTIPMQGFRFEEIADAAIGDKLGGWPCWIQKLEYPSCPRCGKRMVLVFQVTSGDHLRGAFGDFGTGHITQCPEHKDVVAYGSAR